LSTRKIMAHIKGPDLPTGAEVVRRAMSWCKCIDTGSGSFKARATYEMRTGNRDSMRCIPRLSGAKVLETDRREMQQRSCPSVEDFRGRVGYENRRALVLVPKSNRVGCACADGDCSLPRTSSRITG